MNKRIMSKDFVLGQISSYVIYAFDDYERGVVLSYDESSITIKNSKHEAKGDVLKIMFVEDKIRFEMYYNPNNSKNKPPRFKNTDYSTFEDIQLLLYEFVYDNLRFYEYCKNWDK